MITGFHPEMALFPMSCVLRGFSAGLSRYSGATYLGYATAETLVRPGSSKKLLISELETNH